MDASIPKIDSYEKYKELSGSNYPRFFPWGHNSTMYAFYPINPRTTGHDSLVPADGVFPDVQWQSSGINEHNFWLNREAARFHEGVYAPPSFLESLRLDKTVGVSRKIWWHFLHVALKDPSMVAFTPSYDYGMRDRQVVMKVGKYLTKFYGEVMSSEEIRDIVNRVSDREILFAKTADEMEAVYVNGPNSCMSGSTDGWKDGEDFDSVHPVQAYGYIHADGTPEFNVAYLKDGGGSIVARAVVGVRNQIFTRCYGDDGPILQSHLLAAGYELVSNMGEYRLRLKKLYTLSGRVIMPYLDGDSRGIKDYGDHWVWTDGDYDHYADNSEGRLGYGEDENDCCSCDACGDTYDDDDLRYSEHHRQNICECCRDNHYPEAYFNRSHDTTPVHNDQLIYCEPNDSYYLNSSSVLEWHGIVRATDDNWYEEDDDDIFCTVDGEHVHVDEIDDYIETANGLHAKRDDITNDWRGEMRHGDWVWHHLDNPPDDASLKIQFQDDFGTEHTRWEPNPKYVSPGQLWSMKQDEQHDIHDLCGHIQDLGEEWEEEATRPATAPCVWVEATPLTTQIIREVMTDFDPNIFLVSPRFGMSGHSVTTVITDNIYTSAAV